MGYGFTEHAAAERSAEKKWKRNALAYGALSAATFGFDYFCIEPHTVGLIVEGVGVAFLAAALWSVFHSFDIRLGRRAFASIRKRNPLDWRRQF